MKKKKPSRPNARPMALQQKPTVSKCDQNLPLKQEFAHCQSLLDFPSKCVGVFFAVFKAAQVLQWRLWIFYKVIGRFLPA